MHTLHTSTPKKWQKGLKRFLDVLMKNEAKHADMIDIMATQQAYLGENVPSMCKVLQEETS